MATTVVSWPTTSLWIVTDDQMRSTLPTMRAVSRRLVAKGVAFTNGYAAVPWCGPARASILTSRYAHHHGCPPT